MGVKNIIGELHINGSKVVTEDVLEDIGLYIVQGKNNIYDMGEVIKSEGGTIELVETIPENPKLSDMDRNIYVYVVKDTGIGYVNIENNITTLGEVLYGNAYFNKGWTIDINSEQEQGCYFVRNALSYGIPSYAKPRKELTLLSSIQDSTNKFRITIDDNGVITATRIYDTEGYSIRSSFDNTGDGIPETYIFSPELYQDFNSSKVIRIDAVEDITDNNGIHQEPNSHYMKYDEVAAGIGTLPPHVYCYDNSSANYLRYSFSVPEDGIYELAAYLRIKDDQLRGATYTINKGSAYEHAFVTTHSQNNIEGMHQIQDAFQGSYMRGMLVHLRAGQNTIHITNAAGVTKNQHFRALYLTKIADLPTNKSGVSVMDQAEKVGIGLAKGAILPDREYIIVTFNNGAPRASDGFCRVITSNGNKMSIQKITLLNRQTMPLEGSTAILYGKIGCVNSTVNGSVGKEARIFDATLIN